MKSKGFAEITAILFVVLAFVVVAAGAFYYLKSIGKDPSQLLTIGQKETQELPISDSDKTTAIQAELDSTKDADFAADFEELEKEAAAL